MHLQGCSICRQQTQYVVKGRSDSCAWMVSVQTIEGADSLHDELMACPGLGSMHRTQSSSSCLH